MGRRVGTLLSNATRGRAASEPSRRAPNRTRVPFDAIRHERAARRGRPTLVDGVDVEGGELEASEGAARTVEVRRLKWDDIDVAELADLRRVDLVVGADLCYDPLNVPPLLDALEALLSPGEGVRGASASEGVREGVRADADGERQTELEALVEEISTRRRALIVTALRQPETLRLFEEAALERGFAPRDVSHVLRPEPSDGFRGLTLAGGEPSALRVHVLSPPGVAS